MDKAGWLVELHAVRLIRPAADSPAQLMQLREPEPLGMLDHHHRRVRDVHADLDDRRRDEQVQLPARKGDHDPVLGLWLHPSV